MHLTSNFIGFIFLLIFYIYKKQDKWPGNTIKVPLNKKCDNQTAFTEVLGISAHRYVNTKL